MKAEAKAKYIKAIYIVDEKGRLVDGVERQKNDLVSVEALPSTMSELDSQNLEYVDRDAEETYPVGQVMIATTDAQILSQLEMAIKNQAIQVLALNGILLLLFSVVISRMTKPLGTLQDLAASISQGNYELDIDIHRKDEIGKLADSFTVMKEGIRKKVQDLKDLNQISEVLATTRDQKEALKTTLAALSDHSQVETGSVYHLNQDSQMWEIDAFSPELEGGNIVPKKFGIKEGIVGLASSSQKVTYVSNTEEDERFSVDSSQEKQKSPRSLICVPLVENDVCIGVLNFSGKVGKVQFGETDYEFAETIARQLVVTLRNIRMREEIEEHNKNLEEKVKARTAELHQKNQDIASMMQNMHQGLFTITEDGKIHHEYAAYLEEIFETKEIAGQPFEELLFKNSRSGADSIDQSTVGVESIVGEDEMMFSFNQHCLIREMAIDINDQEKIIDLDWDPIIVDGVVEKLMVTVRDVTELRALQAAAEAQKLELSIIGELLSVEPEKVDSFLNNSLDFINECESKIKTTSDKDQDVIAELFRLMHTVKGNARTFGFEGIKDVVHEVESTYDELRKDETKTWDQEHLISDLLRARGAIENYQTIFTDKLGVKVSEHTGTELDKDQVKKWLGEVQLAFDTGIADKRSAFLGDAYKMLVAAQAKSLGSILESVCASIESLAAQLDKIPPEITINDVGELIDNDLEDAVNNIFMHVFRNAIDHGIEATAERLEKGKPEKGSIIVDVYEHPDILEIMVRDDGRGIAIEKIYSIAQEKGIYGKDDPRPANQEIANLIFSSGFSTADVVSDVSGRGVGMDAVRAFLEDEGGSIRIQLEEQENKGFIPFTTVIRLPHKFVYHDHLTTPA